MNNFLFYITKIIKVSLALTVLYFSVKNFYRLYLDHQVFRKIEKEYCEKDAGLMVYVDKIDFSKDIVFIKEGEDETATKIVDDYSREVSDDQVYLFNKLNKKEIYLDLRRPYYLERAGTASFFDKERKMTKRFFTINGKSVSPGIYKEVISQKCFNSNEPLQCSPPDDFILIPSEMPTQGILIRQISSKHTVRFTDYVIEEQSSTGLDIATQKLLFSFKQYTYYGTIGYAKTYDPNDDGLMGGGSPIPNIHSCSGKTNSHTTTENDPRFAPFKHFMGRVSGKNPDDYTINF